jgi:hypothetical protein
MECLCRAQLLGLRSFRAAAALLAGLLAYDVFWVFGSPRVLGDNVMLAVATSDALVGPTRLLFPRAPGGVGEAAGFPFSLLGAACGPAPGPRPRPPGGAAAAGTAARRLFLAGGAQAPGQPAAQCSVRSRRARSRVQHAMACI